MSKSAISAKWACPKIPRMPIFQKQKPRRVHPNIRELLKTYLHQINSFYWQNQKLTFLKNSDFGNVLLSHDDVLPKTKMVRMVNRNLFYNRDLENSDRKAELWRKTEILEGSKNWKISFEFQNRTFEGCFKIKMIFKNILEVPATIPAQFPYIK